RNQGAHCVRPTCMTRVRDAVITLICLTILVPLLVLSTAVAGLSPRHWSGIPLSAVKLPLLQAHPISGGTRTPAVDEVTDELIANKDSGAIAVIPGRDGRVYIETARLSPSLLPHLGHRFGSETVGVIYNPFPPRSAPAAPGDSSVETWWQRTDPPGT